MSRLLAKANALIKACRDFLEEKGVGGAHWESSRLYRFAHFCVMVGKSFSRNRCPERAAALAYTSLLAMIPMLAVALSVSTSILRKDGEERILGFIDRMVENFTPPDVAGTNTATGLATGVPADTGTNAPAAAPAVTGTDAANAVATAAPPAGDTKSADARKQVAKKIYQFVQATRSGALGLTGTVLLIFVAIKMLSQIEQTFNDIWGISRGRSWFARIIQYWAVISLGPVLLVFALGMAGGPHLEGVRRVFHSPHLGMVSSQIVPVVLLSLTFSLLYVLMPNTKVSWPAALSGGAVAGLLWHLNSVFSVLWVSRWASNSKIYGSLAIIPVFMVGLYFAWVILLFGAQVAYACQNRGAYISAKQAESVNQRGREFIALRLMACVGQRFQRGECPATIPEIAAQLAVPTRLIQQIMQILIAAHLVVEVNGKDVTYAPAKPLESVTCHDILLALRAGQGQELATSDEPARAEVYGEFQQILEAERRAASSVTVRMMVDRVAARAVTGGQIKAVTSGAGPNEPPRTS